MAHPILEPARPANPEDWSEVFDAVHQFYWLEDHTLEDTMRAMREQHNFIATCGPRTFRLMGHGLPRLTRPNRKKQWISKLGEWNLKKNISSQEMEKIVQIQLERKTNDGKDTRFTVRGRPVAQENINRWQRRQKKDRLKEDFNSIPISPQTGKCLLAWHT